MRKTERRQLDANIAFLCGIFEVASNDSTQILNALNMEWKDFEDSLQYQTAQSVGCDCIVTRNKKDFPTTDIPVLTPAECLERLTP